LVLLTKCKKKEQAFDLLSGFGPRRSDASDTKKTQRTQRAALRSLRAILLPGI
jgi:hypothetical protein